MKYSTLLTKKGQITIPKEIRDFLKLKAGKRLFVELEKKKKIIKIKPLPDIVEIAGTLKPKKMENALKLRKKMEKNYERK